MSGSVQVDIDALHAMAGQLSRRADTIRAIPDPAAPARDGATAMTGTAFGAACARAGDPAARAYQGMADTIGKMSDAARASATDYESTDTALKDQLTKYQQGL